MCVIYFHTQKNHSRASCSLKTPNSPFKGDKQWDKKQKSVCAGEVGICSTQNPASTFLSQKAITMVVANELSCNRERLVPSMQCVDVLNINSPPCLQALSFFPSSPLLFSLPLLIAPTLHHTALPYTSTHLFLSLSPRLMPIMPPQLCIWLRFHSN